MMTYETLSLHLIENLFEIICVINVFDLKYHFLRTRFATSKLKPTIQIQMPRPVQVRLASPARQPRRGRVDGLHNRLRLVQLPLQQSLVVPDLIDELFHPKFLVGQLQVLRAQLGHQLVVVV